MAVRIRLARVGARNAPFYRVVVADSERSRDGRNLEVVGHYDPHKGIEKASLKKERIQYWLSCGARPSGTMKRILKRVYV